VTLVASLLVTVVTLSREWCWHNSPVTVAGSARKLARLP
jgi:hypothetical protein